MADAEGWQEALHQFITCTEHAILSRLRRAAGASRRKGLEKGIVTLQLRQLAPTTVLRI